MRVRSGRIETRGTRCSCTSLRFFLLYPFFFDGRLELITLQSRFDDIHCLHCIIIYCPQSMLCCPVNSSLITESVSTTLAGRFLSPPPTFCVSNHEECDQFSDQPELPLNSEALNSISILVCVRSIEGVLRKALTHLGPTLHARTSRRCLCNSSLQAL